MLMTIGRQEAAYTDNSEIIKHSKANIYDVTAEIRRYALKKVRRN